MDYRAAFEISAAGMSLEKTRLDISALNLANMHSSIAPGSQGYRPMRVLAQPLAADFSNVMTAENNAAVRSLTIVPMDSTPRLVSDPGHPHADEHGFVRYPGVDQAAEMITAMTALRAYEANVAAAGLARAMASRALEIGGQR